MSSVKLSVALMTHPIRSDYIPPLLERLGDSIDIKIFNDIESNGIWWNAMRAWRAYDEDATHHMVLQDDILVADNLLEELPEVIEYAMRFREDASLSLCDSLYTETATARRNNIAWIDTNKARHAQALIQPVGQIEDFIQWAEWHVRPEYYHDDGRLEIYNTIHGKRIFHTVPSIVEHDDHGGVKRQVKGKKKRGRAYRSSWFVGEHMNPMSINWDTRKLTYTVPLDTVKRWAIGDIPLKERTMRNVVLNKKSSWMHYDDIMKEERKRRGLI